MRILATVVVTLVATVVLTVGAVVLYYYDGGSKDHTYLQVGDCWDYSARFDEAVHLKPCSEPHYGEVILEADDSAIERDPAGGARRLGLL
ncbi:hypothetical protein [Nocardia sp. IFM 10818]